MTQMLRVVSCNVRGDFDAPPDSPDHWPRRAPALTALLARLDPDLLGVQEPLAHQLDELAEALPGLEFLGEGRLGGREGEYSALAYRRDRFRLTSWEQQALSDTPDVVGSVGWGNDIPRVLVRADLDDLATGTPLRFVNTHLDHRSEEARRRGAERIVDVVSPLDRLSVVTGDFNAAAGSSEPWTVLTAAGLADTWTAAQRREPGEIGTFHDYGGHEADDARIDWILVGGPMVPVVERAEIVTETRGGVLPSDHFPILADLRVETASR